MRLLLYCSHCRCCSCLRCCCYYRRCCDPASIAVTTVAFAVVAAVVIVAVAVMLLILILILILILKFKLMLMLMLMLMLIKSEMTALDSTQLATCLVLHSNIIHIEKDETLLSSSYRSPLLSGINQSINQSIDYPSFLYYY